MTRICDMCECEDDTICLLLYPELSSVRRNPNSPDDIRSNYLCNGCTEVLREKLHRVFIEAHEKLKKR